MIAVTELKEWLARLPDDPDLGVAVDDGGLVLVALKELPNHTMGFTGANLVVGGIPDNGWEDAISPSTKEKEKNDE